MYGLRISPNENDFHRSNLYNGLYFYFSAYNAILHGKKWPISRSQKNRFLLCELEVGFEDNYYDCKWAVQTAYFFFIGGAIRSNNTSPLYIEKSTNIIRLMSQQNYQNFELLLKNYLSGYDKTFTDIYSLWGPTCSLFYLCETYRF